MKLNIQILPPTSGNPNTLPVQRPVQTIFLSLPIDPKARFADVWKKTEQRFRTNYAQAAQGFHFTKVKDVHGYDIDVRDLVADIFDVNVDKGPYIVQFERQINDHVRDDNDGGNLQPSTITATTTAYKRPRSPPRDSPLAKKVRLDSDASITTVINDTHVRANEPIPSCEVHVPTSSLAGIQPLPARSERYKTDSTSNDAVSISKATRPGTSSPELGVPDTQASQQLAPDHAPPESDKEVSMTDVITTTRSHNVITPAAVPSPRFLGSGTTHNSISKLSDTNPGKGLPSLTRWTEDDEHCLLASRLEGIDPSMIAKHYFSTRSIDEVKVQADKLWANATRRVHHVQGRASPASITNGVLGLMPPKKRSILSLKLDKIRQDRELGLLGPIEPSEATTIDSEIDEPTTQRSIQRPASMLKALSNAKSTPATGLSTQTKGAESARKRIKLTSTSAPQFKVHRVESVLSTPSRSPAFKKSTNTQSPTSVSRLKTSLASRRGDVEATAAPSASVDNVVQTPTKAPAHKTAADVSHPTLQSDASQSSSPAFQTQQQARKNFTGRNVPHERQKELGAADAPPTAVQDSARSIDQVGAVTPAVSMLASQQKSNESSENEQSSTLTARLPASSKKPSEVKLPSLVHGTSLERSNAVDDVTLPNANDHEDSTSSEDDPDEAAKQLMLDMQPSQALTDQMISQRLPDRPTVQSQETAESKTDDGGESDHAKAAAAAVDDDNEENPEDSDDVAESSESDTSGEPKEPRLPDLPASAPEGALSRDTITTPSVDRRETITNKATSLPRQDSAELLDDLPPFPSSGKVSSPTEEPDEEPTQAPDEVPDEASIDNHSPVKSTLGDKSAGKSASARITTPSTINAKRPATTVYKSQKSQIQSRPVNGKAAPRDKGKGKMIEPPRPNKSHTPIPKSGHKRDTANKTATASKDVAPRANPSTTQSITHTIDRAPSVPARPEAAAKFMDVSLSDSSSVVSSDSDEEQ